MDIHSQTENLTKKYLFENKKAKGFPMVGSVLSLTEKYNGIPKMGGATKNIPMFCYKLVVHTKNGQCDIDVVFTPQNKRLLNLIKAGSCIGFVADYWKIKSNGMEIIQNQDYFNPDVFFVIDGKIVNGDQETLHNADEDAKHAAYLSRISQLIAYEKRSNLNPNTLLAKLKANNYKCAITKIDLVVEPGRDDSLSLDQINPGFNGGTYTDDNTQIVALAVNRMKSTLPLEVFIKYSKLVASNN